MANSLDVVPVWVNDEGAAVVGVMLSVQARRPVVFAAEGQRRLRAHATIAYVPLDIPG